MKFKIFHLMFFASFLAILIAVLWFFMRNFSKKFDPKFQAKEMQINSNAVRKSGIPFVFDEESINAEIYADPVYAVEIVFIEVDSSIIEPVGKAWLETPIVNRTTYKVKAPFVRLYGVNHERENSDILIIDSIDPGWEDSKKYKIDWNSIKDEISIYYRIRSADNLHKNILYKLSINAKSPQ